MDTAILPAVARARVHEFLRPEGGVIRRLETALSGVVADLSLPEEVAATTCTALRALEAAQTQLLHQPSYGILHTCRSAHGSTPVQGTTDLSVYLVARAASRALWLRALEAEPQVLIEVFEQSSRSMMSVAQQAQVANKAAWRLRKWDIYERPKDAARLSDTHAELIAVAEEVCDVAGGLRRRGHSSLVSMVWELTAATCGVQFQSEDPQRGDN